jgi:hypothetical protein
MAREDAVARTCLCNLMSDNVKLHSGKKKIDEQMYLQLLLVHDRAIIELAARTKLVAVDYLVHVAVHNKISLDSLREILAMPIKNLLFSKHDAQARLREALAITGDPRIAHFILRRTPSLLSRLIHEHERKNKYPDLVEYLQSERAKRKERRWDQRLAPNDG